MSKYYLKDHVTDEMLVAAGFKIITNSWGYKWGIRKNKHHQGVGITLHEKGMPIHIVDYSFDDKELNIENYIQDLIELGYVEEMK